MLHVCRVDDRGRLSPALLQSSIRLSLPFDGSIIWLACRFTSQSSIENIVSVQDCTSHVHPYLPLSFQEHRFVSLVYLFFIIKPLLDDSDESFFKTIERVSRSKT